VKLSRNQFKCRDMNMQCAKAREIQCPRIGEAEVEQWLLSTLLL